MPMLLDLWRRYGVNGRAVGRELDVRSRFFSGLEGREWLVLAFGWLKT